MTREQIKKQFFRDPYGSTAFVMIHRNRSVTLLIRSRAGGQILRRTYDSYSGAEIAMGQYSRLWYAQSH